MIPDTLNKDLVQLVYLCKGAVYHLLNYRHLLQRLADETNTDVDYVTEVILSTAEDAKHAETPDYLRTVSQLTTTDES